MNRIYKMINFTTTNKIVYSSGVESFCSFWKNTKYLEYLSAEVGRKYYFL